MKIDLKIFAVEKYLNPMLYKYIQLLKIILREIHIQYIVYDMFKWHEKIFQS